MAKEIWLVFHASSQKPENIHFDEFLLSKTYKDLFEKVKKIYVL